MPFTYSIYEVRDKLRKAGMLEIAKEIRKLIEVFEKNPGAVALNVMRDVLENITY
ncbi:hypothetical protein AVV29_gp015 [Vibrio phage phi 3]|uniref:Uncharacterized protein n=1 Tax=Vibrio phage phi 3 TaxID=1589298 RepID=A0A0B5H8Q4_9CAUD|nr:hypothetical protein AVV29_gp015 [Vibrio phage phi 3]AJF40783.1 hypothetical protein SBVP3_0015 [Vibrio phage phi 3]